MDLLAKEDLYCLHYIASGLSHHTSTHTSSSCVSDTKISRSDQEIPHTTEEKGGGDPHPDLVAGRSELIEAPVFGAANDPAVVIRVAVGVGEQEPMTPQDLLTPWVCSNRQC